MRKLIFLLSISTILACSKNDSDVQNFLDCSGIGANYKSYNGEELGCKFYYTLTEFENQRYIELGARCADLTRPFVINENCVDICENQPFTLNTPCEEYLNSREIIEVVLIQK